MAGGVIMVRGRVAEGVIVVRGEGGWGCDRSEGEEGGWGCDYGEGGVAEGVIVVRGEEGGWGCDRSEGGGWLGM